MFINPEIIPCTGNIGPIKAKHSKQSIDMNIKLKTKIKVKPNYERITLDSVIMLDE